MPLVNLTPEQINTGAMIKLDEKIEALKKRIEQVEKRIGKSKSKKVVKQTDKVKKGAKNVSGRRIKKVK